MSWQAQNFGKVGYRFRGRRSTFARSSADFVAGAVFSYFWHGLHWHGRARRRMQISWEGQHFRKVRHRLLGRGSVFARSRTDFLAGAAFAQGQVHNSWQGQHSRKVKHRFRGSRNTFVIEGTITFFQLQLENRKS